MRPTAKAFGGTALTEADEDRLRAVRRYGRRTNADADRIEGVVAKVQAA